VDSHKSTRNRLLAIPVLKYPYQPYMGALSMNYGARLSLLVTVMQEIESCSQDVMRTGKDLQDFVTGAHDANHDQ
jgi:hypothetical protein